MKPCLFNTEMVRAILEGRKTVTRRVVKEPYYIDGSVLLPESGFCMHRGTHVTDGMPYPDSLYHPGDILYVRETWCPFDSEHVINGVKYAYKADSTPESERVRKDFGYKWCPPIHMPREAARIFLRVTDVRVERLQEITELDILEKEGTTVEFPQPKPSYMSLAYTETRLKPAVRKAFADLWDNTIKKADLPRYGWEANPWVWVIEFKRCEKPEGE